MEFKQHPFLEKHLGDFEENHPLLVLFQLNPEYMNEIEKLFEEVDKVPNFKTRIDQMKDTSNWESALSEIEFVREIISLNPEFIVSTGKSPCPDLKAHLLGKEIFFEVKLLLENDQTNRVSDEVWKTKSDLIVNIAYNQPLSRDKADELIKILKDKITKGQVGAFTHENTQIDIRKKIKTENERTSLITRAGPFEIPFEPIRRTVFMNFYAKLYQIMEVRPIFWVIDCKRWKFSQDDFHRVVYGTITVDVGVGFRMYGLSEIAKKYMEIPEYFEGSNLVPQLRYPLKDGLYFLAEASCINGIVVRRHGNCNLFPNPFAENQIDSNSLSQLKKLFNVLI